MTSKLAWKNIWRNKTRSIIFLCAAFLGLALAIVAINLMKGIARQRLDDAISIQTGHIQVHSKGFKQDNDAKKSVEGHAAVMKMMQEQAQVTSFSARIVAEAVVTTPENAAVVQIKGVHPIQEANLSALKNYLLEGHYLDDSQRAPILISKRTAERLKLKVGGKLVATLKDVKGEIVGAAFRVVGIFETPNAPYDEANVIARYSDMKSLTGVASPHEIALTLHDPALVEETRAALQNALGATYEVEDWKMLLPELNAFNGFTQMVSTLFTIIILIGLGFGLLNTMNMIVQERSREIGMLRAIGQTKGSVFKMLIKEALLLMMLGSAAGILLGIVLVIIFSNKGISMGSGFAALGIQDTIYPQVVWPMVMMVCVLAVLLTLIVSVIPALKALKIRPGTALRD